jgi:hypothetical protein
MFLKKVLASTSTNEVEGVWGRGRSPSPGLPSCLGKIWKNRLKFRKTI